MTYAGTTQDYFILPAPPVGGLPISQDWLDKMKLVHDRTVPIILPSGKNILVDTMFKIIIGYTNLGMRQVQCRLGSRVCPFITLNANMAGYPTKYNVFHPYLLCIHEISFRLRTGHCGLKGHLACWYHNGCQALGLCKLSTSDNPFCDPNGTKDLTQPIE